MALSSAQPAVMQHGGNAHPRDIECRSGQPGRLNSCPVEHTCLEAQACTLQSLAIWKRQGSDNLLTAPGRTAVQNLELSVHCHYRRHVQDGDMSDVASAGPHTPIDCRVYSWVPFYARLSRGGGMSDRGRGRGQGRGQPGRADSMTQESNGPRTIPVNIVLEDEQRGEPPCASRHFPSKVTCTRQISLFVQRHSRLMAIVYG